MFQWNPFYRYSDESVDERNRLLLPTVYSVSQQARLSGFSIYCFNLLKMSYLEACVYTHTVHLLSFRTDCAERILRAQSGGHPQKHVVASLDTYA
jgi:hypothetical protein